MCLVYIEEEIKYLSPFSLIQFHWVFMIFCSVADPDPDPVGSGLFGSPGSGSGSGKKIYGSGSGSGSGSFIHNNI